MFYVERRSIVFADPNNVGNSERQRNTNNKIVTIKQQSMSCILIQVLKIKMILTLPPEGHEIYNFGKLKYFKHTSQYSIKRWLEYRDAYAQSI